MRKEYDFSHSKKNPYTKKLKVRTTIRLDHVATPILPTQLKKKKILYGETKKAKKGKE